MTASAAVPRQLRPGSGRGSCWPNGWAPHTSAPGAPLTQLPHSATESLLRQGFLICAEQRNQAKVGEVGPLALLMDQRDVPHVGRPR